MTVNSYLYACMCSMYYVNVGCAQGRRNGVCIVSN